MLAHSPFEFQHSQVIGNHVITGIMLNDDGEEAGKLPYTYGFSIYRDFAAYHRVIDYHISQNDRYQVIQTYHLFDSIENCLGKIKIDLETKGHHDEISIWRDAFNNLVERNQTLFA